MLWNDIVMMGGPGEIVRDHNTQVLVVGTWSNGVTIQQIIGMRVDGAGHVKMDNSRLLGVK